MSQNDPKTSRRGLKAAMRRAKVIELAAQGLTNQEIADKLKVGEKTVDRDMQSAQIQEYAKGLVQRQIADIESVKKVTVRLQHRGDLLDKLLPKKMEQHIEGGGECFRVEIVDNSKEPKDSKVSSASGST